MDRPVITPSERRSNERGFALLDLVVGMAIMLSVVLATAATMGMRSPQAHATALALQTAVAEARSVALVSGASDAAPSGATILVAADPAVPGGSTVSVYRSRPIPNPDPNAVPDPGGRNPLALDAGFPPVHVVGSYVVHNGPSALAPPFAILVSSAGYVDLVPGYRAGDPIVTRSGGCDEAVGVTIDASANGRSETHPLLCREATYDASPVGS